MGKTKPLPVFTRLKIEDLTESQKDWLDTHREKFVANIGTQGKTKDSAAEYTRLTVIPDYFKRYCPTSTKSEQDEVYEIVYQKVYGYLQNGRRGGGRRRKGKSNTKRIDKTNLWANDNPDAVAKLLNDYRTEKGLDPDFTVGFDVKRSLVCVAFKALPDDVQVEYEKRADNLREQAKKGTVLTGEERLEYARGFAGMLAQFLREAEQKAGVLVVANVAYQLEDVATMEVTSVVSEKIKDYKNTDGYADSVSAWAEYLRGNGKTVRRDKPVEAAYPDRHNENFPLIPKIDYENPPPVTIMRKIIRAACSANYQRLGGGTAVPWTDIMTSHARGENIFIEPHRMPEGFPLIDPGLMKAEYALVWLKWLSRQQNGEGDDSTWFSFKLVYTPSLKWSLARNDALSKKQVARGSTQVYELVYGGWVAKCQVGGRIKYSDEAKEYEDYLVRQAQGAFSSSRPHLLGLPCRSDYTGVPALPDSDIDTILDLLQTVPESAKDLVAGLVKSLNDMYMLLPAETKDGLWDIEGDTLRKVVGHPAVLPEDFTNLPSTDDFLFSWLPVEYFAPPIVDVPISSTLPFLEKWQHRALTQGFLRHAESGTLLGGCNGTFSAVLAILKALLNIGAVLGKFQLPSPMPSEAKDCRISENDWKLAVQWCDNWRAAIEATVEVLNKTFAERTQKLSMATLTQSGAPSGSQASNEPRFTAPALPSAGPSRPTRPRPRPAFYTQGNPTSLDDLEDEELRSLTDSERADSDVYQPPEEAVSESDESDASEHGDLSPQANRKGKKVARGEKRKEPTNIDSGVKALEATRRQYEIEHGVTLPQLSNGPVKDDPLNSHPLGEVSPPKFGEPWTGSAAECIQECQAVKREAKDAIRAMLSSPHEVFPPEDALSALQEAFESTSLDKTSLVVVVAQRRVWNRAKALWPTIQYQFKLFSELTRKLSQFVVTVYAKRQSAPEAITEVLDTHLTSLRRLAYQVRFIYHELHDLGVISKEFFDSLSLGWGEGGHNFSEPGLKETADRIRLWSDRAAQVVQYHEESRQKTWEHHKENLDRHPVPVSIWYRFGNPPPWREFEDLIELLTTRLAAGPLDSHNSTKGALSAGEINSVERGGVEHKGAEDDMEIDSVSPSEDDLRAQKLLEEGGSDGAVRGADETAIVEGASVDRSSPKDGMPGSPDQEETRQPLAKVGPPSKKAKQKRRPSGPETGTAEEGRKPKKKRAEKDQPSNGGAGTGTNQGGVQRSRVGRTLKPSEKARQL